METLRYTGNTITVVRGGNMILTVNSIRRLGVYTSGGVLTTFTGSTTNTYTGDGTVVANQISGDGLFTNNNVVVSIIGRASVPTQLITSFVTFPGRNVLTIGGSEAVNVTNATVISVGQGQRIVIDSDGYTVFNADNTVSRRVNGSFERLLQYTTDSNNVTVSDLSTSVTINGPQTIISNEPSILVTNRSEVIQVITDLGTTVPPLQVELRTTSDNKRILVIGGREIINLNDSLLHVVESYEFLTYNDSTVTNNNYVTGRPVGTVDSNMLTVYRPSDRAPVMYTDAAPGEIFPGPGLFYFITPNGTSFYTSRPAVINLLRPLFNTMTRPPSPPPPGTPEPMTPFGPVPDNLLNTDGSSWDILCTTPCSRTCGVGVMATLVRCLSQDGTHRTTCTNPRERSSRFIPPPVQLCNTQDCPEGPARNGIPTPDQFEVNFTIAGNPFARRCGVGTVSVMSSVANESYIVRVQGRSTETGSTYDSTLEQVNGARASIPQTINLQTMYTNLPVTSTVTGNTITYTHNGVSFPVNVLTNNGGPADECTAVNDDLEYTDGELMFNNRTVSNIRSVRRLDNEQSVVFTMSFLRNSTVSGPLYLCISYRMGRAIFTRDLIGQLRTPYDALVAQLRAPQIAAGTSPPSSVVSVTGMRFQIGTTPISVLEDIHKIMLQCRLSNLGSPPVTTYMWMKGGQRIVHDNVNYVISGDTLTVQTTNDPQDEGLYTCAVDNGVRRVSASSYLNITQEMPITTEAPSPSPPPMPMWFTHPFNSCHKRCSVGVRVRAVRCLLAGRPSTACNTSEMPLSFELCNIMDCPDIGGGSRNGIPLNENLTFHVAVPNGNFEVRVSISLSNNATGNYRLELNASYPDGTFVTNTRTRASFNPVMDNTTVRFGTPLFGKLQAIKTINRIDILHQKILFSVQPLQGDVCYPYGRIQQLIYTNKTIISSFIPQRQLNPINSVVYVNHQGISSFNERSSTKVFNGPLMLCVSTFFGRAFVTNVASLAEDINGHYYNISTSFVAPSITESNGTVYVNRSFASAQVRLGTHVSGVNASYVRIMVVLEHPGLPYATDTEWRVNGQRITSDIAKGRIISSNGFEVIIKSLSPNHAGMYTFTIRNRVGSDSASTNVIYRPMNFGIIVGPPEPSDNSSVLHVGIGLNYGSVNSSQIRTVRVFCPTTTPASRRTFLINGGSSQDTDVLNHDVGSSPSGCTSYSCTVSNGTVTDRRVSSVCYQTPTTPNATITGTTMLRNGGSTLLTCTGTAGYPTPTVLFDTIMYGSNGVVSNFTIFTNGSILIFNAQPNDNTQYCCRAVNSVGNTTRCASITVMVPPRILRISGPVTNGPLPHGQITATMDFRFHIGQTASVVERTTVFIECNATGSPAPTYAWVKDNVLISRNDATGPVLRLDNVVMDDAGTYSCFVRNINGFDSVQSVLSLIRPPNVQSVTPTTSIGQNVTVNQSSVLAVPDGSNFCLRCMADLGIPRASEISWLRGRDGIDVNDICIDLRDNDTLLCFTQITRPYSDTYSCFVSNSAGSDSENITIRVAVAPRIKAPVHDMVPAPSSCDNQEDRSSVFEDVGVNLCLTVGTRVLLDCEINENAFPTPNVTWRIVGSSNDLSSNDPGITIFPNNSLLIDSVTLRNDTYRCSASNFVGTSVRQSAINVTGAPPSIMTVRPFRAGTRQVISVGNPRQVVNLQEFNQTQIRCDNTGRPSPMVSWTVGGRPVTANNTAFMIQSDGSLLITGLQTTACAVYTCNVSNPLGMQSSSVTLCGNFFNCSHVGFSQCSVTCGFGGQSFVYQCTSTVDNNPMDISSIFLPPILRPVPRVRQCPMTPACPSEEYRYVAGDFTSCSHSCGCGRRFRNVTCYLFRGGLQANQVDYRFCQNYANHSLFPNQTEDCNTYECPDWRTSDWGMCDKMCSEGNRTRNVTCVSPANNNATIPDRFCNNGTCPISREICNYGFCPYRYFRGAWSSCSSTCRGGIRTRTVSCYNVSSSTIIDNNFCEEERLIAPPTVHQCGVGECVAPLYTWFTGHFGDCSVTCGVGAQGRSVNCHNVITGQVAPTTFCSAHDRPSNSTECHAGACPGPCTDSTVLCRIVAMNTAVFCQMPGASVACCNTCT